MRFQLGWEARFPRDLWIACTWGQAFEGMGIDEPGVLRDARRQTIVRSIGAELQSRSRQFGPVHTSTTNGTASAYTFSISWVTSFSSASFSLGGASKSSSS
jgi:hypothetical protein